jgi:hypothetical protein
MPKDTAEWIVVNGKIVYNTDRCQCTYNFTCRKCLRETAPYHFSTTPQ